MTLVNFTTKKVIISFFALFFFVSQSMANDSYFSSLDSKDNTSTTFIANNDTLYFLCDGGELLYAMDRTNNGIDSLGSTASGPNIEAIAYNPYDDELYGTDAGTFVHINKADGTVTTIADVDGGVPLTGSDGNISASDIDGLEFDTWGGFYWAATRRNGNFDLLFKIDAATGQVIRDAFGTNIDYIVIDGSGVNMDIDDMAINPVTGKLYAVTTVSGSSKLIEVNRFTGAVISSTDMDQADAEGLGFSSDGILYATIGTTQAMWIVNLDGTMTNEVNLSDGGACSDVEAVTATTAPVDTIGGKVWDDPDMDQVIGGSESGISGVTVNLYYDTNGDGLIDAGDVLIQTTTTDANGDYGFLFGTNADLLVDIDESTLPAGYGMTTDNLEEASFTNINNTEQDYNNNFGATSGADCDGDGIPDFTEGTADTDNDGINDNCDLDSDNDGILDADEGVVDTDGDGILDLHDLDSDNDGIPDAIEANNGVAPTGYDASTGNIVGSDGDNDGLLDVVDDLPSTQYGASVSTSPNPDHDGDGINDYVDLDADNDGILDIIEAGGVDTDLDGMVDSPTNADTNSDGYADALTISPLPIDNTDGNGNPNYIDIDSDDDGLDDTLEGLSTPGYATPGVVLDTDGDGIIDFWDNSLGGNPIVPVDTDGDGTPDYEDLDSDNDSIVDLIEGNDADNDGVADFLPSNNDADGDGLDDAYDDDCGSGSGVWGCATIAPHQDFDNDGAHDWRDIDDDKDGIPTISENGDTNGNGTPDYLETGGDIDGDGITDALDLDNDNDGIPDAVEGTTVDTDGDGILDFLDLDSDNDGIPDIVEAGGTDTDGNGLVDGINPDGTLQNDADNDGLDDVYDDTCSYITSTVSGNADAQTSSGTVLNATNALGTTSGVATIKETNPESYITFDLTDVIPTGEQVCIHMNAQTNGQPYTIEVSSDNSSFTSASTGGSGSASTTPTDYCISHTSDFRYIRVTNIDGGPARDLYIDSLAYSYSVYGDCSGSAINNPDTDNDGIPDAIDLDADNDGIPDVVEAGGTDENGDGIADDFVDTDNDGFNDVVDGDVGNDGSENTANALVPTGTDTNGDGIPDSYPGDDTDGDGNLDHLDLDADNDGIPDVVEAGGTDENGDGFADDFVDVDGDGFNDTVDGDPDNSLPTGDDSADTNTADALQLTGTDANGDGAPDSYPEGDTDGDGNLDQLDLDADNDGIPDVVEAGGIDTDGDGVADNFVDADNDGFNDTVDGDPDNSLPTGDDSADTNTTAALQLTGTDADGDGAPDSYPEGDTDDDGFLDQLDLDADNDGIPDIVEADGIDTNGDGLVDDATDTDNDGLVDSYDTDDNTVAGTNDGGTALVETDASGNMIDGTLGNSIDTDSDGFPDHLDLDADNDGIPDMVEAGAIDPDGDGMVDTSIGSWDSDDDGLADVFDETVSGGVALVETTADTNGDGIVNNGESMTGGASNNINVDDDSNPNHLDLDADNDGITDVVENASGDTDADNGSGGSLDGIVDNYTDTADENGWNDSSNSSTTDTDLDGVPDYLDIDADNDGIVDYLEGVCSTCPTFGAPTGTDTDGDGVLDIYENMTTDNTDNSGGSNTGATPNVDDDSGNTTPDYLDTDSDDDTAQDWVEGYDANDDGNASDDIISMAATYEAAMGNGYYDTTDTDGDGLPDWLDNQPNVAGYDANARPPFLDPATSFWHDDDNDGLVDIFDPSENGMAAPTPDNNGSNDKDWRDQSILSALPVKLTMFVGEVKGCNTNLTWTAKTEEDFSHYELEWSGDGYNYQRLDRIEGQGSMSTSQTYQYFDESAGVYNYYRLKMVDLDGSVEYSKIVYVETDCENDHEMTIYPNPVSVINGQISLKFFSAREQTAIVVVDVTGRIVKRMSLSVNKEWNTLRIDISDLAIGSYFIKQTGTRGAKPFIIQE